MILLIKTKKHHGPILFTNLILFLLLTAQLSSGQTRNFGVEGHDDQMGVIQSLPDAAGFAGSVGLELVRGDENGLSDWRILNENGDLRLQIATDNFQTNGTNYFTILENGFTGIGCSNPQAKLSICSGQIAFSNSFAESQADKISLDGYRFDQTDMVGFGYETSLISGPGGTLELSDLYYKSEGAHRWYSNANADLGNSAFMVLDKDGNLGVGIKIPKQKLDVADAIRITNDFQTELEFYSTQHGRVEAQLVNTGSFTKLSSLFGNLYVGASNNGGTDPDMTIVASTGYVGIGTNTPNQQLDVEGIVRISGGATPKLELYNDANFEMEVVLEKTAGATRLAAYESDLIFQTSSTNAPTTRMTIDGNDGNVGIGTTIPETKLHVKGGTDADVASGGYLLLGSTTSINVVIDDNEIMARNNGVGSTLLVQQDQGDVLLCGFENGQVGIGIQTSANMPDDEYLLAVDGKIIAEEVRVELSGVWPDYVFKPEYKLRSVEELEKAIIEHGHLPGIPSAKTVESEGIELGDMQKRIMEKIEEMSLYIIQQNKEIKMLNERINELSK